jgi:hypothetical protein
LKLDSIVISGHFPAAVSGKERLEGKLNALLIANYKAVHHE